jgi:hypothetical protein
VHSGRAARTRKSLHSVILTGYKKDLDEERLLV